MSGHPWRALIVDDEPPARESLRLLLGRQGDFVIAAECGNGEEALAAIHAAPTDVLFLDVQMPGMDGFETARDIKRRRKTRDLPIIFLTAVNSDPDYAFRGYAAGAVDFISKPFDPWVLRAKVSVFVELHAKNKQLREQTARLREQAAQLRDQSALLAARAGGEAAAEGGAARERLQAVRDQVDAVAKRTGDGAETELAELRRRLDDLDAALGGGARG
jgi:CheY-like chemotaxis protein